MCLPPLKPPVNCQPTFTLPNRPRALPLISRSPGSATKTCGPLNGLTDSAGISSGMRIVHSVAGLGLHNAAVLESDVMSWLSAMTIPTKDVAHATKKVVTRTNNVEQPADVQ